MQNILYVIYIGIIAGFIIFLGTTVYFNAKKSKSAVLFGLLAFITAAWVIANSFVTNYKDTGLELVQFAAYLDLLLAVPLVALYWYFVDSLGESKNNFKYSRIISYYFVPFASLISLFIVISGKAVTFEINTNVEIIYSNYFYIYSTLIGIVFALTLIRLIHLIYKSKSNDAGKYEYLLAGIFTAGVMLFAANTLVPIVNGGDIRLISNLSYVGLLIFIFLTYRAIIVHKLFDIRVVVAKSVAYAFSVGLIVVIFVGGSLSIGRYVLNDEISPQTLAAFSIISIVTAIAFQPVKRFFDRKSNSIFYRDAYEPQDVINQVNSILVNTIDLQKLLNETGQVIESQLKVNYAEFYLDPKASIEFHLAGSNAKIFSTVEITKFTSYFASIDEKLLMASGELENQEILAAMKQFGIECAIKMKANDEDVGVLIIGERKSGNGFAQRDLQLLEIIADEVAIAVQNALRFEEITKFTVTLQKKIDEATKELQVTNEKLRSLDEAKDEFISMASHQLRTPLTSVKGYISMVLEGDAGKISDTQKQYLNQAFVSSQRMVYLIADLLNVSRLKTGKFVIESSPVYLPDVVESELEQLYETAAARGLELVYNKPKSFVTMDLDETKIRQVIMNFVDNAIYYTPRGGRITVALKQLKNSIEYTVTDTGIGVPKKEQHHLFTKFYRAGNAKKARPDGTGLGLYMAKKVVVAQGGAIIFKTSEGKGSTFGFSFPVAKEQ